MITQQPFGKTGHQSTRIIFGGVALAALPESECGAVLDLLFEYGINHIDTAANYGDSEVKIGPWMKHHRDKFFLATKTQLRDYASARDQIRKSLERLQTDHVDLLQLHYLVDENEWQIAMSEDGALRAAVEARDEGLVRYIGVTGHDVAVVRMHARSLARFDFDSILLPYNYTMMQNPIYAEGFEALLMTAQQRGIAVQTIKSLARGAWQGERTSPHGMRRSLILPTLKKPFIGCLSVKESS